MSVLSDKQLTEHLCVFCEVVLATEASTLQTHSLEMQLTHDLTLADELGYGSSGAFILRLKAYCVYRIRMQVMRVAQLLLGFAAPLWLQHACL